MERTGKQDAPDVDTDTRKTSGDNKGATTTSPPSKDDFQLPSVNELLKSNYVLSTLGPDFHYTDEIKADMLHSIFGDVGGHPKWKKFLDSELVNKEYCKTYYMKNSNKLSKCFDDCIKTRNWDPLFNSLRELYRQSVTTTSKNEHGVVWLEQKKSIELSWKATFKGNAPMALKAHVNKYSINKYSYENFCTIIQSSGMGKSRLIDQFSQTHIMIPINLRSTDSTGFPPGDTAVVDYFEDAGFNITQFQSNRLLCYFLTALLTETMVIFTKLGTTSADKLYAFFEEGMTYERHGKNRREFYENVVSRALEKKHQGSWNDDNFDKKGLEEFQLTVEIFSKFIGAEQSTRPEAYFSFDEAHYLSRPLRGSENLTHMGQLRQILELVGGQPLFTFFISTTAKIASVTQVSPRYPDASGRLMSGTRKLVPSFIDLGYDHLAEANKIGIEPLLLVQVVQVPFMANFGRPMWGLCAKNLSDDRKGDILSFAKIKLLNKENPSEITNHQKLACLSQRLALECDPKTNSHLEQELTQVEGHLRVLLRIDEGIAFASLKSVSPSEPLVAEAAALAMKKFDIVEAMRSVLEDFSINQDNRGELLAMLLLIMARDAAITEGPPILYIPQLFRNLFTQPDLVLDMEPTFSPDGSAPSFKEMFKNAGTHFSHFTRTERQQLWTLEKLLALICRGAFVLCANGTPGMDLCGAGVLDINHPIRKANSFLLIWKITNDQNLTTNPVIKLFDKMDPIEIGILDESDAELNIPVIRIVFALGSANAELVPIKPRLALNTKFICYDIWCAGLAPTIYHSVEATNESTWKGLLCSSQPSKIYTEVAGRLAQTLRRQQYPGAGEESGHWDQWVKKFGHKSDA